MPQEVSSVALKKDAQLFSAVPVCRTCALLYALPPGSLLAFPNVRACQIAKCEHEASYLWIK